MLTAWGRLYTHLSTSEKSRDMSYCDQKYEEFLSALNKWMPVGCPGPKEYIGRWARDLGKDKEIFDFLYARREGMTIRDFLTELFKYKRVQLHAMKAGHDISSFESMLKFMPEEHQKAYAELVAEEESYRSRIADYNAKVAAYNQRKAERERIEKENAQVYTRTVERTVEVDEAPESPARAPSEQEEQLDEQPEESKSASRKVLEQVGNTLEKAKDLAGKVFGEIADHEETMARGMSAGMATEKPVKSMLAQPGTKVAKGTPAHSDAKVVKTCGGFQAPLMVFSDFYEKQMLEDPPVNRGNVPEPEQTSEPEAEAESTEELPKEQTVTEVETYRMPQIPLPNELPRPGVPKKPSWWEIGWRRLMGRSVNDTIWDRWCPPEPSNYAELVCPCKDYVYLGEISEEELNRLNFELREISSMIADSQDEDTQNEVEVGVAINRGTSGGIKVLSGTIMIVGSVAGIAAVAASGGTALPVVVMALGTAMIMFGASDTIEGIGDIQAAISRQGLDQMSYNPVRESVFGGNETAYALTETGVSLAFDVITGMAIAKMPTRLKPPAQAFRATSAAGVAKKNRRN